MTSPAARDLLLLGRQPEREPSDAEVAAMTGSELVRAAFGDSAFTRNARRRRLLAETNAQRIADMAAVLGDHEAPDEE